jgi:hypothetical protein
MNNMENDKGVVARLTGLIPNESIKPIQKVRAAVFNERRSQIKIDFDFNL